MYIKKIPQNKDNAWLQQGCCEFLVNELYEEFGYAAKVLVYVENSSGVCTDEELLNLSMGGYYGYGLQDDYVAFYHTFAYTKINNKTYYIDSTGITDDINDILGHFLNLDKEKIDGVKMRILDFKDPRDMQGNFWSTYWDENEKVNEDKTQFTKDFFEKHKKDLNVKLQLRKMRERDER